MIIKLSGGGGMTDQELSPAHAQWLIESYGPSLPGHMDASLTAFVLYYVGGWDTVPSYERDRAKKQALGARDKLLRLQELAAESLTPPTIRIRQVRGYERVREHEFKTRSWGTNRTYGQETALVRALRDMIELLKGLASQKVLDHLGHRLVYRERYSPPRIIPVLQKWNRKCALELMAAHADKPFVAQICILLHTFARGVGMLRLVNDLIEIRLYRTADEPNRKETT